MYISLKHKILFVAIPKTATRSIYKCMKDHFEGKRMHDHDKVIPDKYKDYYTFTVVRNPYDRAVSSWWSTCKRGNDKRGFIRKYLKKDNTFLNFMKNIYAITSENPDFHITEPQSEWLRGNNFNKIISFQNINTGWAQLPFNIEKTRLEIINSSNIVREGNPYIKGHFNRYLCSESIELVNEFYAEDFILAKQNYIIR